MIQIWNIYIYFTFLVSEYSFLYENNPRDMEITLKNRSLFLVMEIIIFFMKKTYCSARTNINDNFIGTTPPLCRSEYNFFTVDNLKCLHIKNIRLEKSYVSMSVDCGSQYDTTPGLAHLLEHLLSISTRDNISKRNNLFFDFLNEFNGDYDSTTSDHMTVYHYEIDTIGLPESLKIFANFFKTPNIEESTIKSEIKIVDAEFQMYKNHENKRKWRMIEIMLNKGFITGNFNTLGTNYSKLKKELNALHEKYYKKMALVIYSYLDFDKIENLANEHFTLSLRKIEYENRICAYCNTKKIDKNQSPLKIDKLVKLKGVSPKKNVLIIIPLSSRYFLPANIYEPLIDFLSRSDYNSYLEDIKRKKLAISVLNDMVTYEDCEVLCIDFTVEDTNKYKQILQITRQYFKNYLKEYKTISKEYQEIEKLKWFREEGPNPRSHVIKYVETILRCDILSTSQLSQHDCPNISFDKCFVVLVDKNFNIQEKRDEYELYYEELAVEEIGKDLIFDGWNRIEELHPQRTDTFFMNGVNGPKLQTLNYKNSNFVAISDESGALDTVIELSLKFDLTLNDQIGIKIFFENINYVCARLLKINDVAFYGDTMGDGVTFKISGRDPLFILTFILLRANMNFADPKRVLHDLYNQKINQEHDHGYKRVLGEIKSLYIDHLLDLDSEISHLKAMLDDKPTLDGTFGFFDKITKINMIISGAKNIETYCDCFTRMVDTFQIDSKNKGISLVKKFITNRPIKDIAYTNNSLLSNSIIRASKTIRAKNKATCLSFRIGKGIRNNAIALVLKDSLQGSFFNELRIDKSLGYAVKVLYVTIKEEAFVVFNVQSQKNVLEEIIDFINKSEFTIGNIQSLINGMLTGKKSGRDLVHLCGSLLTKGFQLKSWEEDICAEIRGVTPQHLKKALQNAEAAIIQSEEFE